ncbi:MAG: GIY-YIG nuclease family protein [Clostridia bacterium]|nr:GIY-YIG nuclease family protein [Clostridia bacterium]
MYYVYMLRCEDNSLYTGITTDVERRMREHVSKDKKCAKYTFNHTAIKIESVWKTENRALASKLEFHIKKLSKIQKEKLIIYNHLEEVFENKIEVDRYIKMI